ncbi:hypothetical protein LY76DRAFT_469010, partial [Colletotrichum caudatum]
MAFCLGVTAVVTNTLGPIVISALGVAGKKVGMLNISSRFVQHMVTCIFSASCMAQWFCIISASLPIIFAPLLTGIIMMYVL